MWLNRPYPTFEFKTEYNFYATFFGHLKIDGKVIEGVSKQDKKCSSVQNLIKTIT